jgi:hypothetical protein
MNATHWAGIDIGLVLRATVNDEVMHGKSSPEGCGAIDIPHP